MKKIIALLVCIVTIGSTCAYAAECQTTTEVIATTSGLARVEETKWYYQTYNGTKQKRLWSITNLCWLTDWITIG